MKTTIAIGIIIGFSATHAAALDAFDAEQARKAGAIYADASLAIKACGFGPTPALKVLHDRHDGEERAPFIEAGLLTLKMRSSGTLGAAFCEAARKELGPGRPTVFEPFKGLLRVD